MVVAGPDVGKNINDQHGTTSNLTPRQLRQLEAFLKASHETSGGTVRAAAPFTRLTRITIRFGANPAIDDDRIRLKARFQVPVGMDFDLAGLPAKAVRFTLADVDEDTIERTIPIGRMVVNNSGTTARFSDPKGLVASGITALLVKRRAATGEFELQVKGKGMDLSSLDKNHIRSR
jgi:hypothetical protein